MPLRSFPVPPPPQKVRRWPDYLFAILGGNVIYFLLTPRLPAPLQHQPFRVDWGLGLDFALCVALYALLRLGRVRWALLRK